VTVAKTNRLPEWAASGPETVAPGVHRLPLPLPMDGLRAVNIYVLETDRGLTCIDGGWALEESRRQLEASLKELGHSVADITRFLVTHVHRDHYTQAIAVRREFSNAVVELGIGDKPTLDLLHGGFHEDPSAARLRLAGAHDLAGRWSAASADRDLDPEVWTYPDSWLEGEERLEVGDRVLAGVPTPGHTAGHYVFVDESAGLLFAGDHVLPTITPSIGFELVYQSDPLGDFLGSLHRVRELPDLRLLPAHGPVTESSHSRVEELLAHHDHRLELCLSAVDPAGSTARDVAGRLGWTRRERAFAELDMFNAGLATMETMVHLDLLARRGALSRAELAGVAVYRAG
jgi:glyoxylase-like metal-dependent hydrolase (beta-lactamase superfamily II)